MGVQGRGGHGVGGRRPEYGGWHGGQRTWSRAVARWMSPARWALLDSGIMLVALAAASRCPARRCTG